MEIKVGVETVRIAINIYGGEIKKPTPFQEWAGFGYCCTLISSSTI